VLISLAKTIQDNIIQSLLWHSQFNLHVLRQIYSIPHNEALARVVMKRRVDRRRSAKQQASNKNEGS
jgi:hypothetical protein